MYMYFILQLLRNIHSFCICIFMCIYVRIYYGIYADVNDSNGYNHNCGQT